MGIKIILCMYALDNANYYNKSIHFIRTRECVVFISISRAFLVDPWSLRNRIVFMF